MQRLMHVALLIGCLAIGLAAPHVIGDAESPAEHVAAANAAFDKFNFNEALRHIDAIVEQQPDQPLPAPLRIMRLVCLIKTGQRDEAIKQLDAKVYRQLDNSASPALLETLASACDELGRADDARAVLEEAIARQTPHGDDPVLARMFLSMADLCMKTANWMRTRSDTQPAAEDVTDGPIAAARYLDRIINGKFDSKQKTEALFKKAECFDRYHYRHDFFERAVAAYEAVLAGESSPLQPAAALRLGQLYENRQKLNEAVATYTMLIERFAEAPEAETARQRRTELRKPRLFISGPGPVQPGQTADVQWQAAAVTEIRWSLYRLDGFAFLRQPRKGPLRIEPQGQPIRTWQTNVAAPDDYDFYNSQQSDCKPEQISLDDPGLYGIIARGVAANGQTEEAHALLSFTHVAVIQKGGPTRTLVWAVDRTTGAPMAEAEVRIIRTDGQEIGGRTDADGCFRAAWPDAGKSRRRNWRQERVGVRVGDDFAMTELYTGYSPWGDASRFRLYGFTDRPIYRPGQTVHIKQIVRRNEQGELQVAKDESLTLRARDPHGDIVQETKLTTNDHGSAATDVTLPDDAALGLYQIEIELNGERYGSWQAPGNQFRVEEYRKPEYEVTVKPTGSQYQLGQTVEIAIEAKYYFGEPVPHANVQYTVRRRLRQRPWWPSLMNPAWLRVFGDSELFQSAFRSREYNRWMPWRPYREDVLVPMTETTADAEGRLVFTVVAKPFDDLPDEDIDLIVEATVVDASRRHVEGAGSVLVTHQPLDVTVSLPRRVVQPGDVVPIEIETRQPEGAPVPCDADVAVYRLIAKERSKNDQRVTEYEHGPRVATATVTTDKTGLARYRWTADEDGFFAIVITAKTPAGTSTGETQLWVAKRSGAWEHYAYRDIEIVLDKSLYAVGETAKVLVLARRPDAYVWLTAEAEDVLFDRPIHIEGRYATIDLPITKASCPNFFVKAVTVRDDEVFRDEAPVIVPPTEQLLDVTIEPAAETLEPGAKTTLVVRTRDPEGKPVSTEAAVMVVDESLFAIQAPYRSNIAAFFYGQPRPNAVRETTSFESIASYPRFHDGMMRGAVMEGAAIPAPQAAMAREMPARQLNKASADQSAKPASTVTIRKTFADAAVWMPFVQTDNDGTATVNVTMPENLTTWRITAIAADDQTRVGETDKKIVTRKDLIARLITPRFLVQGDQAYLSAIVHNYLDHDVTCRVKLDVSEQLDLSPSPQGTQESSGRQTREVEIKLPAGDQARVDVLCAAVIPGDAKLTLTAVTDAASDGLQLDLPVLAYGARTMLSQAGELRLPPDNRGPVSQSIAIDVPDAIRDGSQRLELHVTPSLAAVMLDTLPYLLQYPYGCTEQTMSRFLPAVITKRTLEDLNINLASLRQRLTQADVPDHPDWNHRAKDPVFDEATMRDMVRAGVRRLAGFQHPDGGWGWWQHDESNPYMTAYVVYGLAEAKRAGTGIDASMLSRGVGFLVSRVTMPRQVSRYPWQQDDPNVRVWMLYALATADPTKLDAREVTDALDRIFAERDGLTDYGRALLAITLHTAGRGDEARTVLSNLTDAAQSDPKADTVWWGEPQRYWMWYNGGVEATAMALRAYLAIDPQHANVTRALRWLVAERHGVRWRSTKDTAFVVYAMADYLKASGELDPDVQVAVTLDDRTITELHITKENVLTSPDLFLFSPHELAVGHHAIQITATGRGAVYYTTYLQYVSQQDPIPAAGNEIHVTRRYYRVDPQSPKASETNRQDASTSPSRKPIAEGEPLAAGDLLEVELELDAPHLYEYVMIEDPKPAGCEPVDLHSGPYYGAGIYVHREMRDEKVAFFITYLPQGKHVLRYRVWCETPGRFRVLPTQAEAMYAPHVQANSTSDHMQIEREAVETTIQGG